MIILGINAYHGDASAAIVVDGQLVAAAEEERFNRVKHSAGFPGRAIEYCLRTAGAAIADVDHIAVSRNPSAHLQNKLLFAMSKRPTFAMLRDRLTNAGRLRDVRATLAESLGVAADTVRATQHRIEHHRAHMASAFFVSPFEKAACISVDGFGDFLSAMWGIGAGTSITTLDQVMFPHSIGIFYTAITQYLGFLHYGDEYKVMGLAPYGEPEFLKDFRTILIADPNGYRLDLDYFVHHTSGVEMTWDEGPPTIGRVYSDALVKRFGPARQPGEPLEARHKNFAASLQAVVEEVYHHLLRHLHEQTKISDLCLAGGVAFNSVANGKILANTPFTRLYIQPAAGDSGTALGAAFEVWHSVLGQPRSFEMKHAYWGPEVDDGAIARDLERHATDLAQSGCDVRKMDDDDALCRAAAAAIAEGNIVGWFQGRMEWGPRALGNRSILADPRRADMKDVLNARIKKREPFRPFCPSILEDHVGEYFEGGYPDPFMITVYPIVPAKRSIIPAVTHIDGTGRLQSVSPVTNPLYCSLIRAFYALTGVPVLLNTSFNENEPVVCTPTEAIQCFIRTKMDVLAIGHYVLRKPVQ
jgi:carbamoyltransferase